MEKYLRVLEDQKNQPKLNRMACFTSGCLEIGGIGGKRGDSADRAPGTAHSRLVGERASDQGEELQKADGPF